MVAELARERAIIPPATVAPAAASGRSGGGNPIFGRAVQSEFTEDFYQTLGGHFLSLFKKTELFNS